MFSYDQRIKAVKLLIQYDMSYSDVIHELGYPAKTALHELKNLKGYYHIVNRQKFIVINGNLDEREQLLVAAHELGHDRLHRLLAKISPMKDFFLYDMRSKPEYEANLFASDLLIEDSEIEELCEYEGMDYFAMCSNLSLTPEIVSFKLFSMIKRGYKYTLPLQINSSFLGK